METMNVPVDGLLEGEFWIEYRAGRDLLGQCEQDPLVESGRATGPLPLRRAAEVRHGW